MSDIFLVEDNPDNADLVVDLLAGTYEVTRFVSANDLLSFLDKSDCSLPALFILDISLPGMDGVDLLKVLKERDECMKIPALALTAHAMKGDQSRLLAAGFDAYMSKPIVDGEALTGEISRLIQS